MISMRIAARTSALVALCCAGILLLSGCSLPFKFGKNATTNIANIPHPTTKQLLSALQQNFKSVSSFHVVMQVLNAGSAKSEQVQIRAADGDVVMPDKVKAQATVLFSSQAVTVKIISVDGHQYITDPVTGQWRVVKGVLDPRTITNPDTGLISLVGHLQNTSTPASDTVGSIPCWRITGQLAASYLSAITGGNAPAGNMLNTSICIGKADGLLYHLRVTGQAVQGDTTQTARNFLISKYNEHVAIAAPQL